MELFRFGGGPENAIDFEAESTVRLQHRFQKLATLLPDGAVRFLLRDLDLLNLLDKRFNRIEELTTALRRDEGIQLGSFIVARLVANAQLMSEDNMTTQEASERYHA